MVKCTLLPLRIRTIFLIALQITYISKIQTNFLTILVTMACTISIVTSSLIMENIGLAYVYLLSVCGISKLLKIHTEILKIIVAFRKYWKDVLLNLYFDFIWMLITLLVSDLKDVSLQ